MPRTSPTNSSGFTLVELLVVLAIAALIIGVAVPAFTRFGARNELAAAARQLAADIAATRRHAYETNSLAEMTFDAEKGSYVFAGVTRHLPVAMAVEPHDGDNKITTYFYADGSADPLRLTLKKQGRETFLSINWLTGQPGAP